MRTLLCVILFTAVGWASDSDSTDKQDSASAAPSTSIHSLSTQYSTYIGIAGGYTAGYGLSIRRWFNNDWGLQANLFPMYTQEKVGPVDDGTASDSGFKDYGHLSFGALYLKKLTDFKFGRFSYYAGANIQMIYDKHNYYSLNTTREYDDSLHSSVSIETINHNVGYTFSKKITIGTGAGAEFYIWRFALHIMLGLCGGYEISTQSFSVLPTVEGGIQFRLF